MLIFPELVIEKFSLGSQQAQDEQGKEYHCISLIVPSVFVRAIFDQGATLGNECITELDTDASLDHLNLFSKKVYPPLVDESQHLLNPTLKVSLGTVSSKEFSVPQSLADGSAIHCVVVGRDKHSPAMELLKDQSFQSVEALLFHIVGSPPVLAIVSNDNHGAVYIDDERGVQKSIRSGAAMLRKDYTFVIDRGESKRAIVSISFKNE